MTVTVAELTDSAVRLHRLMVDLHWRSPVLVGPDPGIRWNAKVGRFVKGYTPFISWRDNLVYAQAQKYWIQSNLMISEDHSSWSDDAEGMALTCAAYLHDSQSPEGYWPYPNPEWEGRIATVEGNYAAIGLLLAYARSGNDQFLAAAKRWYECTVEEIGFQLRGGTLAINYFGNVAGGRIPNNSASAIRVDAMLASATGDDRYLEYCDAMMRFIAESQMSSGELPYSVVGVTGGSRPHFLCYQYNAFEFLNIFDYWKATADPRAEDVLRGLVTYLEGALTASGAARYDCSHEVPEVVYYGAAVGAALGQATEAGWGDHSADVDAAFSHVLSRQQDDGGFPYSFGNFGIAKDTRSYPRYLSMILTHLLMEIARRRASGGGG